MPRTRVEQEAAPGTVGARLRLARSSRFVGRRAELELFAHALDEPESAFTVLFGAEAMWRYSQQHTRAGGAVVACRFIVDRDAHQTPGSVTFGLTAATHLQHMLTNVDRAMDFIGGIAVPEQLEPLFTYIDFVTAPDATYVLADRPWTVFVRDWRDRGVDAWFESVADRERAVRQRRHSKVSTT